MSVRGSVVAHRPGPKVKVPKTAYPPFLVQGFRVGFWDPWFAEGTACADLKTALAAAGYLEMRFDRKVRIIDQEEQVWYRSPGIRQMKGTRA